MDNITTIFSINSDPSIRKPKPSKLRLSLYYVSYGLVVGSYVTEAAFFSRFMYQSLITSLDTAFEALTGLSLPLKACQAISGILAAGDALTNCLVIDRSDAQRFFQIKKENGSFVLSKTSHNTAQLVGYKKYLDLILRKGFISTCIAIQAFMGGAINWLPDYSTWQKSPWFNYIFGPLVTLIGFNSLILFLSPLIHNTYLSLWDIYKTPAGHLFKLSKLAFSLPASRLLLAVAFNTAIYTFYSKVIAKNIFRLALEGQLAVQVSTALAIAFTSFGSRFARVFKPYVEPYLEPNGEYNLSLVTEQMRKEAWSRLPTKGRWILRLKSSPLAIIRLLSFFNLVLTLAENKNNDKNEFIHSSLANYILAASCALLTFLHAYLCEQKKELSLLARDYNASNNQPQDIGKVSWGIAAALNLLMQLARGLLAIYSYTKIFEGHLDIKKSAAIGLTNASEISWANFWLFQPAIATQVSKIGSYITRPSLFSQGYRQVPRISVTSTAASDSTPPESEYSLELLSGGEAHSNRTSVSSSYS